MNIKMNLMSVPALLCCAGCLCGLRPAAVLGNELAVMSLEDKVAQMFFVDLDGLTGRDSMEVEEELVRLRKGVVIEGGLNTDYIIRIFCKACQEPIGSDAFGYMSLTDYNRIKTLTRNFLLASGR